MAMSSENSTSMTVMACAAIFPLDGSKTALGRLRAQNSVSAGQSQSQWGAHVAQPRGVACQPMSRPMSRPIRRSPSGYGLSPRGGARG